LPKDINSIEERLRSRFEWGLIADIQPPDLKRRSPFCRRKRRTIAFSLPDDVAEYIARAIKSNVREFRRRADPIDGLCLADRRHVSLATAQQVLRNIIAFARKARHN